MALIALCRRVVERPWFQHGILAVIVLNAVLIGAATNPETLASHRGLFQVLNALIQVLFVVREERRP